jgi:cullin-4
VAQLAVLTSALDESLYRADTDALTRLFVYCQQAQAFKVMTKAVHDHIEARIRTVIADPANDRQMIDSVLKLKRFVDKAVAGLWEIPAKPIEATEDGDIEMEDAPKLSQEERGKQLELEDAVRTGFKAGLGSRKNAPAEWIGELGSLEW